MRTHCFLLISTLLFTACRSEPAPAGAAAGGGRGGPTGVSIVTMAPRPLQEFSDFISTVRSLHSTTVQPQVEGRVTKIFVKSGDVVALGTPLLQIDPERQAATVRNTESQRTAREADVTYWKSQVERLQTLLTAGAISQNEFDTAKHSLETAQANLGALDAQVREGSVQLQYYHVTAPAPGVVGDLMVREGDRVTTSTAITTIDDRSGLEAYIQVPVDRAPDARLGLPVQILDGDGKVIATNTITFIAPRVDPSTQTVLAKSLLKELPPSVRVQQFVRTRVIWRTVQGLSVPITAALRINGQYFVYLAEQSGQGFVARQHPVKVGEVQGNDYVVKDGLKAGDRLIVAGIQKIADGAPVRGE
ncbi:MAG TPA: efflux RND transporter periplasmic adaptor subunit [Vicinamibacterales bacterium]|jgi:RND family efflux transporter MFP subunit